jgi:hypothetical protein
VNDKPRDVKKGEERRPEPEKREKYPPDVDTGGPGDEEASEDWDPRRPEQRDVPPQDDDGPDA